MLGFPLGILSAAGAGGVPAGASDYELLETAILVSNTGSVTFSSLGTYSATYKHLQIRFTARTTTSTGDNLFIRMNGVTTSNYSSHTLRGNGTSVTSTGYANESQIFFDGGMPGSNAASNIYSGAVIDFLDAFSTTKNKTTRAFNGFTSAASNQTWVNLNSGVWRDTSALTSITLTGATFVTGCRFSLYGIKG